MTAERLSEIARTADVELQQLVDEPPTLEDVFLRLTTEARR
jgi:hypothetical protein